MVSVVGRIPVPVRVLESSKTERVLVGAAIGYGLWLAHTSGYRFGLDLYRWVPGLSYFRSLNSLPEKLAKGFAACRCEVVGESARAGSREMPLTTSKSQVKVGVINNGNLECIGGAVRFPGDWLVGPDHVLSVAGGLKLVIRGTQGTLPLSDRERVLLATDMVAIKLTPVEWSAVGAQIASIGALTGSEMANVVGPMGQGTTGEIRNGFVMGTLEYSGTTLAGYSGCGYFIGNACIGIHQRGGAVNGGMASAYLRMLLNRLDSVVPESDILVRFLKSKRRFRIRVSPGNPDELEIEAGGNYYTREYSEVEVLVGAEKLEKALSTGYHQNDGGYGFTDTEEESRPVFPNARPGGSNLSKNNAGQPGQSERLKLTNALANLSVKKLNQLLLLLNSTTQVNSATPGSSTA
nr:MAG: RNA-dependent RNA polymerase [Riboviria sp.]